MFSQSIDTSLNKFDELYKNELGSTKGCNNPQPNTFKVCSETLRNDGNAPFILHHHYATPKVVVLFHGLSDSPFYFRSIARSLFSQGHNVVVALLPGHGKKQADKDMQDNALSERWRIHVKKIAMLSKGLGEHIYIGGFSTGGALATEYVLLHPDEVKGLLLFSGALALDSTVETLSNIWGVQWILKLLDGEYNTQGDNPYKYPSVSRFSVGELMEVIRSIRELSAQENPNIPIFAAHSMEDTTTPIEGIKTLLSLNKGASELFTLSKSDNVCHGDLVLDKQQANEIGSDKTATDVGLDCFGAKANPRHVDMLNAMNMFLDSYK